jgi:hypothetical protein
MIRTNNKNRMCSFKDCKNKIDYMELCASHIHQLQRGKELTTLRYINVDIKTRILSKITTDDTTDCWNWNGYKREGYGRIQYKGTTHTVHRLMYKLHNNGINSNESIHHICANTLCVNPDHLQSISQRENTAEMLERKFYISRIAELENIIESHRCINV